MDNESIEKKSEFDKETKFEKKENWKEICKGCEVLRLDMRCSFGCDIVRMSLKNR
jgi:hypothetical protein